MTQDTTELAAWFLLFAGALITIILWAATRV